MTERQLSPTCTAVFKLGVRWQQAGNWRAARVAFRQVLDEDPEHALALHDIAVCELRDGLLEPALMRLERLREMLIRNGWPPLAYSVTYNLGVAQLNTAEQPRAPQKDLAERARETATDLASRILAERDRSRPSERRDGESPETALADTLARLEGPAIVLCASARLVSGKDAKRDPRVPLLDRRQLFMALGTEDTRELNALLEKYARETDPSPRTRYNLACYLTRHIALTGRPDARVVDEALRDLAFALEEPSVRPLAATDPALRPLRKAAGGRWDELVGAAPPEPDAEPHPE